MLTFVKRNIISIDLLYICKKLEFMLSIDPKEISPAKLQGYLQSAVAPRPIAFASTLDVHGNPNLSPFSFFNVFSSNPPILIFLLREEFEITR